MDSVYVTPPRTILEVYESLPEGTLAQLINNQVVMSPSPSSAHQRVLDKVYRYLGNFVEENSLGETLVAPYDVFFNKKNSFQPDIIFIATENLHKIKENGFYGAPDLVIEILFPATSHYDKEDKKDEYERNGVKEYWLMDPIQKDAEGFYLSNNEFQSLGISKELIRFKLFDLSIPF